MNSITALRARALLASFTFAAVSAASAASCGNGTGTQVTPEGPCATFKDQCGKACTADDACATGLYCSAGKCAADCTASGQECSANATCNARGRCAVATGTGEGGDDGINHPTGSGGSGGGTPSTSSGNGCPDVSVAFTPQTPTVMLLIDQSSSMNQAFSGKQSRWDVVYGSLMNPTNGIVKTLQDKVRFGLTLYTWSGAGACPQLAQVKTPALNAFAAIDALWSKATPVDNTPTGDSINAIVPQLADFAEPGPKLILLATDGDPDSCADPNSNGQQPPKDLATNATKAAFAKGIETVVVAVGDELSTVHQQDMANAGEGLPVPAPAACTKETCATTYSPATQQAMIDAFSAIINGKRTCSFALDGQVAAGKQCSGTVLLNDMPVTCDDPDGWKLSSPTQIDFVGKACESILTAATVKVSATFPCGIITPPPK